MRITLVRHTSLLNPDICSGVSDSKLSESFIEECRLLLTKLDTSYDSVYSSPSRRCSVLADTITGNFSNFKIDERLLGFNYGIYEGKKWEDVPEDLKSPNSIMSGKISSESFHDIIERTSSFIKDLEKGENSLLITHSGAIKSVLCYTLGIPHINSYISTINFGGVTILEFSEKNKEWGLIKFNS